VLVYQKLHAPIVGVHKLTNLVQIDALKIIHLSTVLAGKGGLALFVEDDRVASQVDSSRDGVLNDKFTNLFDKSLFCDLELLANIGDGEALVLRFTFNHEDLEGGVFESAQKLLLQLAFLEFLKSCEHGYGWDSLESVHPVALVECSSGFNYFVSAGLWDELHALLVVLFDELPEVSWDDVSLDSELILRNVWNLQKHRSSHVYNLDVLQVDLQVWWGEPSLLFDLFLECLFLLLSVEARASLS